MEESLFVQRAIDPIAFLKEHLNKKRRVGSWGNLANMFRVCVYLHTFGYVGNIVVWSCPVVYTSVAIEIKLFKN